jgi:hypothetical protein
MRISLLVLGLLMQQGRTVWDGGSYHCEPLGAKCKVPSAREIYRHKRRADAEARMADWAQPTMSYEYMDEEGIGKTLELNSKAGFLTWNPDHWDCKSLDNENTFVVTVVCKPKDAK